MVLARPTAPHKRSNCSANQHSSGLPSLAMLLSEPACRGSRCNIRTPSCKAVLVSTTTHFFVPEAPPDSSPVPAHDSRSPTRGKLLRQGQSAALKTLTVPGPDGPESRPADPLAQGSPGITAPGSLANFPRTSLHRDAYNQGLRLSLNPKYSP